METITNIKIVSGSTPVFTHDLLNLTHRYETRFITFTHPFPVFPTSKQLVFYWQIRFFKIAFRLSPGLKIQLPCSATGNGVTIIWRKDRLTVVETLRIAILPSGTLILNDYNPDEDSGRWVTICIISPILFGLEIIFIKDIIKEFKMFWNFSKLFWHLRDRLRHVVTRDTPISGEQFEPLWWGFGNW